MVFDGQGPLVKRWNGFNGSNRSNHAIQANFPFLILLFLPKTKLSSCSIFVTYVAPILVPGYFWCHDELDVVNFLGSRKVNFFLFPLKIS